MAATARSQRQSDIFSGEASLERPRKSSGEVTDKFPTEARTSRAELVRPNVVRATAWWP